MSNGLVSYQNGQIEPTNATISFMGNLRIHAALRTFGLTVCCIGFAMEAQFGMEAQSAEPDSNAVRAPKAAVQAPKAMDPGVGSANRALKYLRDEGESWMNRRGCVSCHQIPFMIWSLSFAHQQGLEVGADELGDWIRWSVDPVSFVKPERKESQDVQDTLSANIDTMAALLLAVPKTESTPSDWRQLFIDALCRDQAEDGSWKACGQLPMQKRPSQETAQVTTMWVALAMMSEGQATGWNQEAALEYAEQEPRPVSTEWYAVRLMVAAEQMRATSDTNWDANAIEGTSPTSQTDQGEPEKTIASDAMVSRRGALIELQNEDGGWGWIAGQPSDALATGLALYALNRSGGVDPDVVSRARRFLIDTQTEQGNWKVFGTKKTSKSRYTPTSNYWGTAWAVTGLLSDPSLNRDH